MKAAVFAYSRQGCKTARRIREVIPGEAVAYTVPRLMEPDFQELEQSAYQTAFSTVDALVFVGSCGIAVRKIAPYVSDKRTDPAVVCVDELGTFVIPLLSGHIGGANALAKKLARGLEATAVITTATDINRKFSVDAWAAEHGFSVGSMAAAKAVSAGILEGNVPLRSDFPIGSPLPAGVIQGNAGALGIYLTCGVREPFERTLRLIPKVLRLGIGCRKGTEKAAIHRAVEAVLRAQGLDRRAVKGVASIDLKAKEQGLLDYCEENGWPVTFYSAEELKKAEGEFTPSEFVQSVTGVDNVCERAAGMGAGKLIVKKTACSGVTVAVALEDLEVCFG